MFFMIECAHLVHFLSAVIWLVILFPILAVAGDVFYVVVTIFILWSIAVFI